MARSEATTVEGYLAELPEERREVISAVRDVIVRHLPDGYEEGMNWGMIAYEIPLSRYPKTNNGQPVGYVALAAQKHYYSLYLQSVADPATEARLRAGFQSAGKKLDLGKCCVRFRKLADLPLDVVAEAVAATPPEELIARHEASRRT